MDASVEKTQRYVIEFCILDSFNRGRVGYMAERKSALKRAPKRPELQALLERAKTVTLTDDELREQRASFVYGNAPKGSRITRESAKQSVVRVRLLQVATR
jgi:hypothetical protein